MLSTATFVFLVNTMNTGYKLINRADSPETMPLTGRQQGKPVPMLNRQVFKKKKRIIENG